MPTIKINQKVNFDFEEYTFGDSLEFSMQFFSDDALTIPLDVSTWSFFMDIKQRAEDCGCVGPVQPTETLAIGTGITRNVNTSIIDFSKILVSVPGNYVQSIRSVEPSGRVITREQGTLKIDAKI